MVGRASFRATDEQRRTVRAMAGYGIPQDEIARVVINPATGRPITRKTLARHFGDEIATGATQANMLAALEARDYETASQEALDSKWAEQVGARAARIAQGFRGLQG